MDISRIVITGDFLRPLDADPTVSESVRRIRWFEDLLTPPLAEVTDLPIARLACDNDWRLTDLYAECGLTPSMASWACAYTTIDGSALAARIVERCRGALVIGIEVPPSIARVLRYADIPLIDAVVDPHRFLFDIPLAWRSTSAEVRAAIGPFRTAAFEIRRRAAQIRAKTRWLRPVDVPQGSTLILDQVPTDAAMIDPIRQRMVGWADYLEPLERLMAEGPVIWRPHPSNPVPGAIQTVLADARRSDANMYQLLSHDHLSRVVAISSGGVVEARAFGKDGVHLLDRYAGVPLPEWSSPAPVLGDWLSPHFWSAVLAPLVPTRRDVPRLEREKDFLRRSVNWDWGFGWIDQVVVY